MKRWAVHVAAMTLVVVAELHAPSASAGSPTPAPSPTPTADALFRQGREAMKKGDFATACARFADSQRIEPAAGTLLNLAECEERTGKLARAWSHTLDALVQLSPSDERTPIARARLIDLEKRTARMTVTVEHDAPSGTELTLDDDLPIAPGTVTVVDPGEHVVRVSAPGHVPRRYEASLAVGRSVTLAVAPGPGRPSDAPTLRATGGDDKDVEISRRNDPRRFVGWTLLAVGAGGVGLGVVGAVVRNGKLESAASHCPNDVCVGADDEGAFHDALDGATTWKRIMTAGLVGGGLAAASGAILLITSPAPDRTSLHVRPVVGGDRHAGIVMGGTW
jgi:hypothetical protein